jgi:hypothetical protein
VDKDESFASRALKEAFWAPHGVCAVDNALDAASLPLAHDMTRLAAFRNGNLVSTLATRILWHTVQHTCSRRMSGAFQIHQNETGAYKPAERLLTHINNDVTASN